MFEPFYRAEGAREGGSGLGLAIARGFVEANGGRLWAESLPGQGTTFVVELPLRVKPREGAPAMNDRRRVLVVDDEPQILRAMKVVLGNAGFDVVPAATASEAIDAVAVKPPDAAIVDLVLPDGDGVQVTEQIREWSRMPIIVLSAVGDEAEKVRALNAGADDYVTKPFGSEELIARLNAALRRMPDSPEQSVIAADGLEIDLAAHTVSRDGAEVHLTPTEFELLKTLATQRGRLITHSMLLREVWGAAYEEDTQVLRVHIANLRRKIEPEPGQPRYITTDPGVGYRFRLGPRAAGRAGCLR